MTQSDGNERAVSVDLKVVAALGPREVNEAAVKAMLRDARAYLAAHEVRLDSASPNRLSVTVGWDDEQRSAQAIELLYYGGQGQDVKSLGSASCEACDSRQSVARVLSLLEAALPEIETLCRRGNTVANPTEALATPEQRAGAPASDVPSPVAGPRRPNLGTKGVAGVVLVAVGGSATIVGIGLLAAAPRRSGALTITETSYRIPGSITFALGLAAATTGTALLTLARAHKRRGITWAPLYRPDGVGLAVTGQF